jgi:hypothetical protein
VRRGAYILGCPLVVSSLPYRPDGLCLVKLVHGGFHVVVANLHMSSGRIQPCHQDPPHLQKLRSLGLIELKVNEAEQEVDILAGGHGRSRRVLVWWCDGSSGELLLDSGKRKRHMGYGWVHTSRGFDEVAAKRLVASNLAGMAGKRFHTAASFAEELTELSRRFTNAWTGMLPSA